MRIVHNIRRWGLLTFAGLFGCSSQAVRPVTTRPVPATSPAAAKPFLFNEAGMPAGFPPPGPVGVVMVKQYPTCREACVRAKSGEQDSMFMSLFNHIKTNDIPMTTPVEMTWETATTQPDGDAKLVSMAFVYGEPSRGTIGEQGKVDVIDMPAQMVVSIGVRGGYNQKNLMLAVDQLRAWIAARPGEYAVSGLPRYLGYNSPFVPGFLRFGEVQLPVKLDESHRTFKSKS